jgi:DegV family protein with EDD domain
MNRVIIVTDSSAYLPQEVVDQYHLIVLPLVLTWQGEQYRDGVDISAQEFYTQLSRSNEMASTSQVTVGQFEEIFKPLLDAGNAVFYAGISSGISASFDSAEQAKVELGNPENLVVFDSQLVSMALGLMIITLARAAEAGASLQEIVELAKETYPKIGVYFTVNTLEYLHKGGRINTATRFLGSALNVKPLLEIRGGKIEAVESVISRKKALSRMLELIEKRTSGKTPLLIAPFHALCEDECRALEATAVERLQPDEVFRSEVSPVIGAHVGPGTLAIAWMAG